MFLEQLYPFPEEEIQALFDRYAAAGEVVWVQEEAQNMGVWEYIRPRSRSCSETRGHCATSGDRGAPALPKVNGLAPEQPGGYHPPGTGYPGGESCDNGQERTGQLDQQANFTMHI